MPLSVAATPIGNLGDVSQRLKTSLGQADLLLAEDTRQARKLLSALNLPLAGRGLMSLHAHNEQERLSRVLDLLQEGSQVLLLSDAGTPGLSDPGTILVSAVHDAGLPLRALPGPSAAAAALSVSGFPGVPFHFLGFPPRRAGPRSRWLRQALSWPGTLILFEAATRATKLVADLAALVPDRSCCLCRELTKVHEEIRRSPLLDMSARLLSEPPRGEITLVVAPGTAPPAGESPRQREGQTAAAALLAQAWGLSRRDIYKALSRLKSELSENTRS